MQVDAGQTFAVFGYDAGLQPGDVTNISLKLGTDVVILQCGYQVPAGDGTCQTTQTLDFPNLKVEGLKYQDTDGNEAQGDVTCITDSSHTGATEKPLQGWKFALKEGTTVLSDLTSDASGGFTQGKLAPGVYTIEETPQTGFYISGQQVIKTVQLTLADARGASCPAGTSQLTNSQSVSFPNQPHLNVEVKVTNPTTGLQWRVVCTTPTTYQAGAGNLVEGATGQTTATVSGSTFQINQRVASTMTCTFVFEDEQCPNVPK